MGKINVLRDISGIKGLCIIEFPVFTDRRGYLYEAYNDEDFFKSGLNAKFVQDNQAFSKKGVLRGFGVNTKVPQAKLIRVLSGKIFDVVIDLRPDSETFMKWFSTELSDITRKQLYIPQGFGHAYLALEDSEVLFKVTSHYIPGDEVGFAWNSKIFGIAWPLNEEDMIFSDKDRANPEFSKSMVV